MHFLDKILLLNVNFLAFEGHKVHISLFIGRHSFVVVVCLYYPYIALRPYMDQAIVLAYHISDPG